MRPRSLRILLALWPLSLPVAGARAQTDWDPNAIAYPGPPTWQQAAVATLNRHLPTDSGYFVLGPLDLEVQVTNPSDPIRTTLRVLAPDPRSSRLLTRRLWVPTGGVALEELQPSDSLLIQSLPPGYPGRLIKGTIVGDSTLVQVLTVQEHRWLLWAERSGVAEIRGDASGPVARYSNEVARYLAAIDSGFATSGPPRARAYGLDPIYELYAEPPAPVVRELEGYLDLLARHREFTLNDAVRDVLGFIPGPELLAWFETESPEVLYPNKNGELALQHRYREYENAGGGWIGFPVLSPPTLSRLEPGRYVYAADRYGFVRVAPGVGTVAAGPTVSAAMLMHGDPVRAAGELVLVEELDGSLRVAEINIRSEDYFFSNRSLSLYEDVEVRSDRYLRSLGPVVKGLDTARVPVGGVLIRKF